MLSYSDHIRSILNKRSACDRIQTVNFTKETIEWEATFRQYRVVASFLLVLQAIAINPHDVRASAPNPVPGTCYLHASRIGTLNPCDGTDGPEKEEEKASPSCLFYFGLLGRLKLNSNHGHAAAPESGRTSDGDAAIRYRSCGGACRCRCQCDGRLPRNVLVGVGGTVRSGRPRV